MINKKVSITLLARWAEAKHKKSLLNAIASAGVAVYSQSHILKLSARVKCDIRKVKNNDGKNPNSFFDNKWIK
jgi:hypothetical protein